MIPKAECKSSGSDELKCNWPNKTDQSKATSSRDRLFAAPHLWFAMTIPFGLFVLVGSIIWSVDTLREKAVPLGPANDESKVIAQKDRSSTVSDGHLTSSLFPTTLTRKRYMIRWLIMVAIVLVAMLAYVGAPIGIAVQIAAAWSSRRPIVQILRHFNVCN